MKARRTNHHVLMVPSWYATATAPNSGSFFTDHARALKAIGLDVGVIFPDLRSLRTLRPRAFLTNRWQTVYAEADRDIPVVRLAGWNPGLRRLRGNVYSAAARGLAETYVEHCGLPSLVHGQSAIWGGVAAQQIAKTLGIPCVVTEHSSAYARHMLTPYERAAARRTFLEASAITAVSEAMAQTLADQFSVTNCHVIPNPVDWSFFDAALTSDDSADYFLAVGSLDSNKGQDRILRAFVSAFRNQSVSLHLAGDGPQARALQNLVSELGLSTRVVFLGVLNRSELIREMSQSIAVVSASAVETFGLVLAEAQALGIPVVATDSGGTRDIVSEENGLLIPDGEESELAGALGRVYSERARWRARRSDIRRQAVTRFHPEVVARQFLDLYERVATKGPR